MLKLTDLTVGQADKVYEKVVDTFVRESEILELLPFDNAVTPSGKGSTLIYGYTQTKAPSKASFRAIGQEYTPSEATIKDLNVKLKIFGGSFQIDRVIKSIEGKLENMDRQLSEKIKAAVGLFHDTMINGDSAKNALEFDGLDKFLVGTSTEFNTDKYIDLSTIEKVKANADEFYEMLLKLINSTGADALLVNEGAKTKIQTVARILGYKTESEEAFGRTVTSIGEGKVRLIDLKNRYSVSDDGEETVTEEPIINVKSREIEGQTVTGLTDIYAVKFDIDKGFCGVTITGDKAIDTYLPDFETPGAVKTGEVEMVSAVALKDTHGAGVLRNIKI
ncbi:MAG: phage capsid protein [Clostridia bacterium]|nr:phage capsid protein [Clostridia bacterium]